jgi:hypothetical protein
VIKPTNPHLASRCMNKLTLQKLVKVVVSLCLGEAHVHNHLVRCDASAGVGEDDEHLLGFFGQIAGGLCRFVELIYLPLALCYKALKFL